MDTPPAAGARRPLAVVNPRAGRGRAGRGLGSLLGELRAALGELDMVETRHPGHAVALAAAAAAEHRPLVISVGGDGTLNEVVNGLLAGRCAGGDAAPHPFAEPAAGGAASLPLLGLLTTGSGGDFGRALGIPHRPEAYIAAIVGGGERAVDVGCARFTGHDGTPTDRYWINVLSAGLGGLVDRYVAATPGFVDGRLAYAQATLRAFTVARRVALRCRAALPDGSASDRILDAYAVVVCNGSSFGGGMKVAPMAQPDDGLLDVITLETESRLTLLRRFATVYAGKHLTEPGVGHFRCRSLELSAVPGSVAAPAAGAEAGRPARLAASGRPARRAPRAGLFPLDVDGDALGDIPLSVRLLPGALRICAPGA